MVDFCWRLPIVLATIECWGSPQVSQPEDRHLKVQPHRTHSAVICTSSLAKWLPYFVERGKHCV